jgi:PEP-CTERM motif
MSSKSPVECQARLRAGCPAHGGWHLAGVTCLWQMKAIAPSLKLRRQARQAPLPQGLSNPGLGLAFNNRGDLFVGNVNGYLAGGGSVTEITPAGTPSTFVSGIGTPSAMVFNSAGDLFVGQGLTSHILEYAPDGTPLQTITISGAQNVNGLAFQGLALPVPEPSALALIAVGGVAVLSRRFRKNA